MNAKSGRGLTWIKAPIAPASILEQRATGADTMNAGSLRKAGGKRIGVRKARAGARRATQGAESDASGVIVVTAEQRRHLIEDAAYFRAERYREVEPGTCRRQDLCDAQAQIESALKKYKGK